MMHQVSYRVPPASIWDRLRAIVQPRRRRHAFELPATWADLPDTEIMPLLGLFHDGSGKPVQLLRILRKLAPIPDWVWNRLEPEVVRDLLMLLAWFYSHPAFRESGSFMHRGNTYLMPRPGLTNLCGIEYANAEQLLRKAMAGDQLDLAAIDQLVATICRPAKRGLDVHDPEYDGDPREKYNGDIASRRAVEFQGLSMGLRIAVMQWYVAEVALLQQRYSVIWPPPDEDDDEDPEPADLVRHKNPLDGFGFTAVLLDLAETGTFGDWEKVAFTNIHTLLTYLAKRVIEAREAERQRLIQKSLQK